jgi:peptidyl-prolyl cis-trans isomerase B (cyclophilin B)
MGVKVKRIVLATLVIASMAIAPLAHAGTKPNVNTSKGATSANSACKASYAVGHAPKTLAMPVIKKPFKNRTFTFKTNCGDVVVAADGIKAPLTVISMAYMANNGYFDATLCHRLTTKGIYVLQCGDPTASGSGGPAWQVPDENLPAPGANAYPAGTVAMANSGANTNGSQFFIVYADNSMLGPNYTIWGHITQGLDIIKAIAAKGSNNANGDGDGSPNQTLEIIKASAK